MQFRELIDEVVVNALAVVGWRNTVYWMWGETGGGGEAERGRGYTVWEVEDDEAGGCV